MLLRSSILFWYDSLNQFVKEIMDTCNSRLAAYVEKKLMDRLFDIADYNNEEVGMIT
jgi:hypothetical protein